MKTKLLLTSLVLCTTAHAELISLEEEELESINGQAGVTINYNLDSTYSSAAFKDQNMEQSLALVDGITQIPDLTLTLDVVNQIPGSGVFTNDQRDAIAVGFNIPTINMSNTLVLADTPDAVVPDGSLKLHDRSTTEYYRDYLINPNTWADKDPNSNNSNYNDNFTITINGNGSQYALIGQHRLNEYTEKVDETVYSAPRTTVNWQWQRSTTGCRAIAAPACNEEDFNDNRLTDERNEYITLRVYGDESTSRTINIDYDKDNQNGWEAANDAVLIVLDDNYSLLSGESPCSNSDWSCSDANDINPFDTNGDENFDINLSGGTVTNIDTILMGNPRDQYLMRTNISGSFNISGSAYIFAD